MTLPIFCRKEEKYVKKVKNYKKSADILQIIKKKFRYLHLQNDKAPKKP